LNFEINAWNGFEERFSKLKRGKAETNKLVGSTLKEATNFKELSDKKPFLVLNQSANNLSGIPDNSVDYIINVLALWQIGAVPVPLNIRLNDSEITEQLTSSNCKTVLIQSQHSEKLKQEKCEKIIYPIDYPAEDFPEPEETFSAEDPAVIIFTSGTTNKSKGIVLSFRSLYNSAVNGNHLLRYTFSDRWLASLPFYHIGGFSILTRSIMFGIPLIIPDTLSTDNLISALNNFQPRFISLVAFSRAGRFSDISKRKGNLLLSAARHPSGNHPAPVTRSSLAALPGSSREDNVACQCNASRTRSVTFYWGFRSWKIHPGGQFSSNG